MFGRLTAGKWPGLDVAFLLDAAAYHTDRDTADRIRAGTLQVLPSGSSSWANPHPAQLFIDPSRVQAGSWCNQKVSCCLCVTLLFRL